MKTFEIYIKHSKNPEAVKLGWSWPGFFAGIFWMLAKGMLLPLFLVLFLWVFLLFFLSGTVNEVQEFFITFIVTILMNIIFGAKGNTLRVNYLIGKGYQLSTTINAKNPEVAISRFENPQSAKENDEPQESVISKSKGIIKRKIQESASSDKKPKSDYAEELKEAKALLDDDLINEEDYERIKQKIIDNL